MPHIDARTGEVIIRVVYDGPPEAGKTTNIEQIVEHISAQRLGECRTEPAGQRTEYFDWLDFSGGYVDGRRVRCQLMTVPGQDDRARRRRYLLERADVVVFVVDSRPTELMGARDALQSLSSMLVDLAGPTGVGLIIQANKQDAAAALPPEGVLQSLALAPDTPVVPTVAATGHGVMETFVVAARVATERVRALTFEKLEESTYGTDSPEGLRNAIQKVEADEQAAREAAERAAREAAEREAAEREAHEAAVREAREAAEREAREAREAAEREAREAREAAEREAREAREAAEREAAAREAREAAEREAREAAEREAREAAERETAEREAREAAEREAREAAEREAREAAEREAREAAEREARETAEREAREAAEREALEAAERELREAREASEREAAERKAREAAERKAREAAEREAAERKAREAAEREAREAAERKAREAAEREAAERKAREESRPAQRRPSPLAARAVGTTPTVDPAAIDESWDEVAAAHDAPTPVPPTPHRGPSSSGSDLLSSARGTYRQIAGDRESSRTLQRRVVPKAGGAAPTANASSGARSPAAPATSGSPRPSRVARSSTSGIAEVSSAGTSGAQTVSPAPSRVNDEPPAAPAPSSSRPVQPAAAAVAVPTPAVSPAPPFAPAPSPPADEGASPAPIPTPSPVPSPAAAAAPARVNAAGAVRDDGGEALRLERPGGTPKRQADVAALAPAPRPSFWAWLRALVARLFGRS